MSDILDDYREWRDKQPERIGTHSDRCHMWHDGCMIHRLAGELDRLLLASEYYAIDKKDPIKAKIAADLAGLLERMR